MRTEKPSRRIYDALPVGVLAEFGRTCLWSRISNRIEVWRLLPEPPFKRSMAIPLTCLGSGYDFAGQLRCENCTVQFREVGRVSSRWQIAPVVQEYVSLASHFLAEKLPGILTATDL